MALLAFLLYFVQSLLLVNIRNTIHRRPTCRWSSYHLSWLGVSTAAHNHLVRQHHRHWSRKRQHQNETKQGNRHICVSIGSGTAFAKTNSISFTSLRKKTSPTTWPRTCRRNSTTGSSSTSCETPSTQQHNVWSCNDGYNYNISHLQGFRTSSNRKRFQARVWRSQFQPHWIEKQQGSFNLIG